MDRHDDPSGIIHWFRNAAPYVHQHRGRTFVVFFSGEAVDSDSFDSLVHDLGLLHALGIRLVLAYGARPQIERRLALEGIEPRYVQGLRVTDGEAMERVIEAVGRVRVWIEARLTLSLVNTPMSGSRIRVSSGNFLWARPLGVRHGVDFQHTGEVRKVDVPALRQQLDQGQCVLLSPLGYSPTGEVFNLSGEEVAAHTAGALEADKLILLNDGDYREPLPPQLDLNGLALWLDKPDLPPTLRRHLESARAALQAGVARCHIVSRHIDGGLLQELFTRDGVGTLVTSGGYEGLRPATIDDVGGILELIAPLEAAGALVKRSREQLELEIDHFFVIERDGLIVACAALYPFPEEQAGELACLAVHPDYRGAGRGDQLLHHIEAHARRMGLTRLFVLSTQTMHWFQERGYLPGDLADLPVARARLYNYQRRSRIFVKKLRG